MSAAPGPRPRLVASDVDGTLLGRDGHVSSRTRAVIARVVAAGVPFVVVTGRPARWVRPLAPELAHHGLAVCANGALLYDLATERVLTTHLIDGPAVAELIGRLRTAVPGVAFAVERQHAGFGHEASFTGYPVDDVEIGDVLAMSDGGVLKLLARHPDLSADALLAAARTVVGERAVLTHSGDRGLLEISARGITKASGLAAVAADLGVEAGDAVAFGDMPNDLPMLAWAGRGFAMRGGHPDVLAAADEIAPGHDEDGVAQVLERWF